MLQLFNLFLFFCCCLLETDLKFLPHARSLSSWGPGLSQETHPTCPQAHPSACLAEEGVPPGPHITPRSHPSAPRPLGRLALQCLSPSVPGPGTTCVFSLGSLTCCPWKAGRPTPSLGPGYPPRRPPCGPCGKQLRGLSTRRRLGEGAVPSPLQAGRPLQRFLCHPGDIIKP